MVEVNILDTSSVTINGATITGPANPVFADSVTVGASTFTEGVILVQSTVGTQSMPYPHLSSELFPFFIVCIAILGIKFGLSLARSF